MESSSDDLILAGVSAVGLISLCCRLLVFLRWVYKMFLRPPKDLLSYGSWAIITGSTDGIGKALAFELSSKGLNLICVSRNPAKLESTAAEIHAKVGPAITVRNVTLDFNKSSPEEIMSVIGGAVRGLDVGLLVNNVGMAYSYPRFFHETDEELVEAAIRINVQAAMWMTRAVMPLMRKKKKGAIVNIGSGSSVVIPSMPLYTVYTASKAFMTTFSRSIGIEYRHEGIDIQCQAPLFISTKMTKLGSSLMVSTPEMYARWSLRWMGQKADTLCSPVWGHSLQSYLVRCLPDALVSWCFLRYFVSTREKVLRRKKMRELNQAGLTSNPQAIS
ncbi:hypothetical protein SAY87_024301 [Trapa incisa]|uniref:Uncharacterized protein n=1 Tax=Trapa incisa TaxID=236973 RepID=A0AAN7GBT0_9MYRT|nr:hypothetical protein SAY87_024301 [Trapa incisa]